MANKLTFADSTHEVIKTEVIRPGVEGITPGVLVWYKYQRIKHIWPALVVEVLQKNKVKLQTKHSYDVLIARVSNTKSFRTYVPKWCRTQTWESMYNNPENREIVEDLNEAIKYMKHYDKENYKLLDADVKQFEQQDPNSSSEEDDDEEDDDDDHEGNGVSEGSPLTTLSSPASTALSDGSTLKLSYSNPNNTFSNGESAPSSSLNGSSDPPDLRVMSERQQLAWALKQSEPEKERKKRAANARFKNPQKALQNITSTKGRDYLVTDNSSGAMQTPAAKEAKPKRKRKKILDDAFVTPPAKKKKTSSEGPGSDPLYSVEKIVDKRVIENGGVQKVFYKVKWLNYGNSENTWEPYPENFPDNTRSIIREYEGRVAVGSCSGSTIKEDEDDDDDSGNESFGSNESPVVDTSPAIAEASPTDLDTPASGSGTNSPPESLPEQEMCKECHTLTNPRSWVKKVKNLAKEYRETWMKTKIDRALTDKGLCFNCTKMKSFNSNIDAQTKAGKERFREVNLKQNGNPLARKKTVKRWVSQPGAVAGRSSKRELETETIAEEQMESKKRKKKKRKKKRKRKKKKTKNSGKRPALSSDESEPTSDSGEATPTLDDEEDEHEHCVRLRPAAGTNLPRFVVGEKQIINKDNFTDEQFSGSDAKKWISREQHLALEPAGLAFIKVTCLGSNKIKIEKPRREQRPISHNLEKGNSVKLGHGSRIYLLSAAKYKSFYYTVVNPGDTRDAEKLLKPAPISSSGSQATAASSASQVVAGSAGGWGNTAATASNHSDRRWGENMSTNMGWAAAGSNSTRSRSNDSSGNWGHSNRKTTKGRERGANGASNGWTAQAAARTSSTSSSSNDSSVGWGAGGSRAAAGVRQHGKATAQAPRHGRGRGSHLNKPAWMTMAQGEGGKTQGKGKTHGGAQRQPAGTRANQLPPPTRTSSTSSSSNASSVGWGGVVLRSSGGALMVVERRLEFASADKQQHGLPVMAVAVEFI